MAGYPPGQDMDTPPGFAAYPNESSLDKGRHATDIADIFSMEAVDIERDIPRAHPGNPHRFTYMVEVPMLDSPGGISCDDNELDALFKAVGFVVVQWGQAEQSLDLTTAILYQDLEGRPLVKRLPKMLETKLEFVEKCLAKMPSLASVRADGEVLVADFRTLSAKRHDLIHGAIASVTFPRFHRHLYKEEFDEIGGQHEHQDQTAVYGRV
ncbi:MAG: hypothetical protein Nkreftii_000623 [Candidatus Nitrospira kreftii]|uniref:Uncharacterized protein n=1 Tax=Candidatus Nitrospira kreftii TaxID=2652173 RepID=A0A7S8IY98_9BACT|nr:MAG: hypothetical protein Nkreftii_000623 [Candidatus Nitrospira kreftii]